MASGTDNIEIACAYRTAADSLIAPALKSGEAWRFIYPVLFLYRHALELHLKAILQPSKRTHELRPLIRKFENLVKTRFGENLPTEIKEDLEGFSEIDPDSQAFRYSDRYSETRHGRFLPGEYWVSLRNLGKTMDALCEALERVHQRLGR